MTLLLAMALGGCAPEAPRFASVAASLPAAPAGNARIFIYRWLEPYETVAPSVAYLNGQPTGVTETGAVLYRDVAPGRYLIAVGSPGIYPDQFKMVTVTAGETVYARVESFRSWSGCGGGGEKGGSGSACWDTFAVQIMDPAAAQAELGDLRFIHG
jgi:hypothetical protein